MAAAMMSSGLAVTRLAMAGAGADSVYGSGAVGYGGAGDDQMGGDNFRTTLYGGNGDDSVEVTNSVTG